MEASTLIRLSPSVQLEARIYDPSTAGLQDAPPSEPEGLAIIAHPYGSLGGSFDDHVVCALAEHLLVQRRYEVVTYNSRGVGQSTGRASWTGAAEADDYQSVLEWAMKRFEERHPCVRGAKLVLCGYSAGSLYCSTARVPAELTSRPTWSCHSGHGPVYVLVSYPRGVLWALSLFQSARFERALRGLLEEEPAGDGSERRKVAAAAGRVLIVYGTQDEFTSDRTYTSWISSLPLSSSSSSPRLEVREVEGADHFWRTRSMLSQLVASVEGVLW